MEPLLTMIVVGSGLRLTQFPGRCPMTMALCYCLAYFLTFNA
jgi:hypothetical protein